MKELKEFTVERLEYMIKSISEGNLENSPTFSEISALAKIALTAKRATPVAIVVINKHTDEVMLDISDEGRDLSAGDKLYTTPPLTHTEQDGWIKCSDRNPSDNGVYICWDGRLVKTYAFLFGNWQANQFIAPNITHWMHRPAAPKPEM